MTTTSLRPRLALLCGVAAALLGACGGQPVPHEEAPPSAGAPAAIATVSSTHSISGTAEALDMSGLPEAGINLKLAGPSSATVVLGASRGFRFDGLVDGTYTVTPYLAGFNFSPLSRTVVVSGADATGVSFEGTAQNCP